MMMEPDSRSFYTDLFYLVAFGPGYGESIALRVPGSGWFVLDCLEIRSGDERRIPALRAIDLSGEELIGVALTHPHEDHVMGLDGILDHSSGFKVGCFKPVVEDPTAWAGNQDGEVLARKGVKEDVLAAIQDRWERFPETQWELKEGSSLPFPGGKITALFPDSAMIAALALDDELPSDINSISSPMLVEWHKLRVLLGADLPMPYWKQISRAMSGGGLGRHSAYKVAHHGSGNAFETSLFDGSDSKRLWVIAPWNRGRGLPRFEDGENIQTMLGCVTELHLTSLPFRYVHSKAPPLRTSRTALRGGRYLSNSMSPSSGLSMELFPEKESDAGAWIAAGFDSDGSLQDLRHGCRAVVVTE